jgi:homospermidine synthase
MRPRPIKIAQAIFRDWCARHGVVVDVAIAASLVDLIAFAIEAERAYCDTPTPGMSAELEAMLNDVLEENKRLRNALQRIADVDVEPDIMDTANVLAGIAWAVLHPTPGRKTG